MKQTQNGYTLVELLMVIVLIGVLSGLAMIGIPNAQRSARDTERVSDIDNIHSRLEDYFVDHAGYPPTVSTTVFPRLDPAALEDPSGGTISIKPLAANQLDATNTANPTKDVQYTYTAYPAGCGGASPCNGYVLKAFIEAPTSKTPNPYVKRGINNN